MTEHREKGGEQLTTEIERKFLVNVSLDAIPNIAEAKATEISQGYLANTASEAIRIRRKGDKYYMTYKGAPKEHAAEKVEIEQEISKDLFDAFWPATEGRRVEKTRYEIPYGDHTIELDVFEGDNQGCMMAEVEFLSTTAADLFTPPDWFGTDVTADKRFGNGNIAEHGFPEL